jgi:hypothetical protein
MDYFSELLDSFKKLRKRTYKLTYLTEAGEKKSKDDGKSSQEDVDAQANKDAEAKALEVVKSGLTQQYDDTKRVKGGEPYAFLSPAGKGKPERISLLLGAGYPMTLADKGGKPDVSSKGWKSLVNYFKGAEDVQKTEQDKAAEQEEIRYEQLAKPETIFLENGFDKDPNNPDNIKDAVDALNKTFDSLKELCLSLAEPKPKYCSSPGRYLSGQSTAGFSYKLANGEARGLDGKIQNLSPSLINEVARNHKDFMDFLTGEGDCKTIQDKVGTFDGKLFIFGSKKLSGFEGIKEDPRELTDFSSPVYSPTNGIVINTSNTLQKHSLASVRQQCPDFKEKNIISPVIKSQGLNTIRATVDEKCMIAAVQLANVKTKEDKEKALKDIAEYIQGKGKNLIEYAKLKIGEESAKDFALAAEEAILLEQAQLASEDGGRPLVRYTLMTILRHMEFVKAMGADYAGDLSTQGGSGGRSDTVFYYTDKNKARAAAKKVGLDPDLSVTKSNKPEYGWEIGIGQKDKQGSIGGAKLGEYNTNNRRRAAIRGEIDGAKDPKFQEGFNDWAYDLQFNEDTKRFDSFLDFENELEDVVGSMQTLISNGGIHRDAGKIAATTPENICKELAGIVKNKLSYNLGLTTEIGNLFSREGLDWGNAAHRAEAAEMVSRHARLKIVKEALDDPIKSQAAKDWIIRNAIMTGGNYRDIITVITSHDDNKSLAVNHNKVFKEITSPNAEVSFDFIKSGSTVKITANGKQCSLGFEPTGGNEGVQTRTVCGLDKANSFAMGKIFEGPQISESSTNTLHQYMVGQMKLLETLISQTNNQ